MSDQNRGVVYTKPGTVEVRDIAEAKFEDPKGRKILHGAILKVISTNICGSDQHMVRGRTTAPAGMVLGHEITGEVIEIGSDVEMLSVGDIVSVPFNVACGRCRNCKGGHTDVCETVNDSRDGGAYGYVDLGGWIGGQSRYVMVPYADFNLLKFPDRDQAMNKIRDLTMITDIFPTGYHACIEAGVTTGSTVFVSGAGPVGLASCEAARLLGAAVVIVSDMNKERLAHAKNMGFETVYLSESTPVVDQVEAILGVREVDCAVDAVGFEAKGGDGKDAPAIVLNQLMDLTRSAGSIGIPGLYVTGDPGAHDEAAKTGGLLLRFGTGWAKSHSFRTGQTPVMRYNRELMMAILHERCRIADVVNATVVPLEDAAAAYAEFDAGVPKKFVIDPHGMIPAA